MLTGTIDTVDGKFCVRYASTLENEPVQQTLWWVVQRIERTPGAITCHPTNGDVLTKQHGPWVGSGYRAYTDGSAEAFKVEYAPVQCPPTRGKQARWNNGRWEKLMARGWVSA